MRVPAPDQALAKQRARDLRHQATPAEAQLWTALRGRALDGIRTKRQVPFGPYILDFAIPALKVAVELDGDSHYVGDGLGRDRVRDAFMAREGWRVVRFTNTDVLGNLEGVLTALSLALAVDPHPGPLPQAGEGEVA